MVPLHSTTKHRLDDLFAQHTADVIHLNTLLRHLVWVVAAVDVDLEADDSWELFGETGEGVVAEDAVAVEAELWVIVRGLLVGVVSHVEGDLGTQKLCLATLTLWDVPIVGTLIDTNVNALAGVDGGIGVRGGLL